MSRDPFDFFDPAKFIEWQGQTVTAADLAEAIERQVQQTGSETPLPVVQTPSPFVVKSSQKNSGIDGADGIPAIGHAIQPPVGSQTAATCVVGVNCEGQCAQCQAEQTYQDMRQWARP